MQNEETKQTENTVRDPTNETSDKQESNSQKETPEVPIVASPPPLTIDMAGGIEPLYNAHTAGKIVEWPPWIIETKNGLDICPQELFIHISDKQNILSVKLGNSKGIVLYIYKNGYYELWNDSDCKAFIKGHLPRRIRRSKDWEDVFREFKTEYANTEEEELNANEDIVNFKNGIFNIKTNKLEPHSPKYLSTIQINANYIPDLTLDDAPLTKKFLIDITGGNAEDIDTILEVTGLIISNVQGWRFKKLLILKGKGNTGKSVLRELATSLVGIENTFTLDISQLNSRFGSAGIYSKRLIRFRRYEMC